MARAIRDGWREYFVGRSAIQLILGNMAFPDRLHRKLADTGAELQKSDTPETGRRPNNLDGPID